MFKSPRGTFDILPEQQNHWKYLKKTATDICELAGFQRIETPIFEDAEIFSRTGEDTDIVDKEMYTFPDRGGQLLALRPEGTASVCRSYIQHGMSNLAQPVRLYYFYPLFRYERPQAGRYRQHHQFGLEAIGDSSGLVDVEVIKLAWRFINNLGIDHTTLVINSIGDKECRPKYIQDLKKFYSGKEDQICKDCKVRLHRNPLRLLDDKKPMCQEVSNNAPRSIDYLCSACDDHWNLVQRHLTLAGLDYRIDNRLVRGLDYYNRTVFEIQPRNAKSQSTILAGGRYDGLIQQLGGKPTPGMGFGTGFERLILNMLEQDVALSLEPRRFIVLVYTSDQALEKASLLVELFRDSGIPAVLAPSGRSLKSQMRYATSMDATHAAIVGESELINGTTSLRNMTTRVQEEVKDDDLIGRVAA